MDSGLEPSPFNPAFTTIRSAPTRTIGSGETGQNLLGGVEMKGRRGSDGTALASHELEAGKGQDLVISSREASRGPPDTSLVHTPSPLPSPSPSPASSFSDPSYTLVPPSSTPFESSKSCSSSPSPSLPSSPSFHTPTFSTKTLLTSVLYPKSHHPARHRFLFSRLKWSSFFIPIILILVAAASTKLVSQRHRSWNEIGNIGMEGPIGTHNGTVDNNNNETTKSMALYKRDTDMQATNTVSISIDLPTSTSSSTSSTSSMISGSSSATSTTSTGGAITVVPTIPPTSSPPVLPTPFPQPWDSSSLGLNFSTQGCLNFFINMTNTAPFRSCRSFGMLEAWSTSFVDAQTNLTLLNDIIWGTCNPPLGIDQCTANMRWFERELVKDEVCGTDLDEKNESVVRTRAALLAYPLLQTASCLPFSTTNTYCYVSSISSGTAADVFLYSLPLGDQFPNSSAIKVSCSACEKDLLGVFGTAFNEGTTSSTPPSSDPILNRDDTTEIIGLKSTYQNALNIVENTCGAGFVQAAQGSHSSSAIPTRRLSIGFGDAHETLGGKVWVTWFLVVAIFAARW